jgi:hypothetical protein
LSSITLAKHKDFAMSARRVPRRKKRMHELFGFPDSEGHQAGHQDRILDGGCIQNLLSYVTDRTVSNSIIVGGASQNENRLIYSSNFI